jgi:malonyl-CoA O-methyltransferase
MPLAAMAAHDAPAPWVILDIGCSTGPFTHPLTERFQATRVIAIDPSLKMLKAARSKRSSDRVKIRRASAEELPMNDGSADLAFMSMTLHHFADRPRAARECRRARTDRAHRHTRLPLSAGAVSFAGSRRSSTPSCRPATK